ncbi:MAG: hypothetical protein LC799_29770 [Actinobacteria bacterium]|nr:hypothetical protein [Actinomycetota bacterium]
MSTPNDSGSPLDLRWVFADGLAHVLADNITDAAAFVALCGLAVPATVSVYRVAPSLDVCQGCGRGALLRVAPPEFPSTPTAF